jgi:cytochrome c peroxidase
LPGDDLGRGDILKLNRINRGFKTPGLRELAWTAPYMHDGSLPTLEAVVDHYSGHIVDRPTLSADLNKKLRLTDEEKTALVAFLMTLSSDEPPRAMSMSVKVARIGVPDDAAVTADTIGQKDKKFRPDHVRLRVGEKLKIINDDIRTHNVRVDDPRLRLNSGAQEPGDSVELDFPAKGTFDVTCGIHPIMRLQVDVQ